MLKKEMKLAPATPGTCPECATEHLPGEPHNLHSMFYQLHFRSKHGRWPTWDDAMAHCDDGIKVRWREVLEEVEAGLAPA